MTFTLDSNEITIESMDKGLRLTTASGENQLLANVSAKETEEVVTKNYNIVKDHYRQKTKDKIPPLDLEKVSLKIVLHYFYMYQLWRTMYKREKNRDLTFINKDFNHPYTFDEIISHFKKHYPTNYAEKCQIMLDMTADKFIAFEKNREAFFDMF